MNQREEAIGLKLEKAKAEMAEVDIHLLNGFYNTAINKLYYSCFHATKALLLVKDLSPKSHSGVAHLLHQHFVQNNLFHADKASFFSLLLNKRIESDYSDSMISDIAEVLKFLEPAKDYLNYIIQLISELKVNE